VGTARVEVSQKSAVPLLVLLASLLQVGTLSIDKVGNNVLDHGLGAAVCVRRTDRAMLGNRNHVREAGGIAVDGSGGGEDDVVDIVALHGAEKGDAATDIDAVILEGDFTRLADSLEGISRRYIATFGMLLALRAAKWMTLSISGCLAKTSSIAFSSVMSSL
jgi:hypothetical protein